MKISPVIILILCFAFIGHAQNSQQDGYGRVEELKGLTKIYVDTGSDRRSHDRLANKIEEYKIPILQLVSDPEEAEVILLYRAGVVAYRGGWKETGKGFVLIKGTLTEKSRLVMDFDSKRHLNYKDHPTERFIDGFVKIYKKANGIK